MDDDDGGDDDGDGGDGDRVPGAGDVIDSSDCREGAGDACRCAPCPRFVDPR